MLYAEDFDLPDGHVIITTRDAPFCSALEPHFKKAIDHSLLRPYKNVDVGVICRDRFKESPEGGWIPNDDLYIAIVRVKLVIFRVISSVIGDMNWQNGVVSDPGLLHGAAVHRIYDVCRHRTVAVLGRYVAPEFFEDLITPEGLRAQEEKMRDRDAEEVVEGSQNAWREQFHEFRKRVQYHQL